MQARLSKRYGGRSDQYHVNKNLTPLACDMYKKVFEKKFPSSADATEFLDSTGWNYVGGKGFLRRFHLYEGVTMMWNGTVSEKHKLRLYSDGHVVLYNDYSINGTLGVSALPPRVWPSEDIYHHLKKCVDEYNEKLANDYGHVFYIENEWHLKYGVYELKESQGGVGKVVIRPSVKSFKSPREAFDWCVSEINKT
jgi:hypothetical protein